MTRPFFPSRGFTLLELLLVLALGSILMTATYLLGMPAIHSYEFQRTRETVNRELWRARSDTIANVKDSSWGIRFSGSTLTRYRGSSYLSRQVADDVVYTFGNQIVFSGAHEVTFLRPEGTVTSTQIIFLLDAVRSVTITIPPSGAVLTP